MYYWFLLLFLLISAGCNHIPTSYKVITCKMPQLPTLKEHLVDIKFDNRRTITIWIHGTRAFFAKFLFTNYFYTRKGLHCALTFDHKYHVREMAELLHCVSPTDFCLDDFYFFGWSGKLSFKARYKAARKLYNNLIELITLYEKNYGYKPKIRIITHSHGGNVALNVARFNDDLKICIDELILLACPVQQQTRHLPSHNTFKKIYSLYSRFDSIQVLDPQWMYYWLNKNSMEPCVKPESFFSERSFPNHEKIHQVQLKLNNRGIMHIEFITNKFVGLLPVIMAEIKSWDVPKNETNRLIIKLTRAR